MNMYEIISQKRRGRALSEAEIRWVVEGFTRGEIPDYQMSALCMAICFQDMTPEETAVLTDAMAKSGDMVDLRFLGDRSVDKHSTGGVGDKTTLIVAPLAAALGGAVAKMSGRGLGHTGGTVDKLEAIPGYHSSLSPAELLRQAETVGVAVAGQSGNLAPADKKIYALRDVTATVDSVPLIASSIMSKKLAAGARSIVLDVKVGSGAFAKTEDFARRLAGSMLSIGVSCGRRMTAILSNMDEPLGWAVGNALEVKEAVELLQGAEIPDLKELCIRLAAAMLSMSRGWTMEEAREQCAAALADGRALRKFQEWIEAQGGDPRVAEAPEKILPQAAHALTFTAPVAGCITRMDTEAVGAACVHLGAGRRQIGDRIDPAAGLVFHRKTGDPVSAGEPVATLYGSSPEGLEAARAELQRAVTFGPERPEMPPLILDTLRG